MTWTRGSATAPVTTVAAVTATAHRGATQKTSGSRAVELDEQETGALAAPVQDAAAVPLRHGAMLLGGLTAADLSRGDIRFATSRGDRAAGWLPTAVHDAAATRLGGFVYVFGGGTATGTQSDEIVRVPVGGGGTAVVARLPSPSSDQAAAVIRGTAYVVGGYTGTRWLDTIVAWRPDSPPRVVARLPFPLRYAAVTAAVGKLVIAGGSLENGSASDTVLEYRPGAARVTRIGTLPAKTTHAGAATLDGVAYVIGGRGGAVGTPSATVVAVDPQTRRVFPAGLLRTPRSDLAAVSLGDRILLAGGRGRSGAVATIGELRPRATAATQQARRRARSTWAGNVYAFDRRGMLTGAARRARPLVYVPNSRSDTVDVIDPRTFRIVRHFAVGGLPQHVVPSWDLRRLYVTNDTGNSLTPIDPRTGKPGPRIPVEDPYNMYFSPDGRYAIVVAERLDRLDFRDPHTFVLRHSLSVPCRGVDHMDFSANQSTLLASCEFSGQLLVIDVEHQRLLRTVQLPDGPMGMPQDVKLSADGRTFYVADMHADGVWKIDARSYRVRGFLHTGAGTHGLYPSRDSKLLYVSNRSAGTVSVVSFRSRRVIATWRIPGGSPDMGGVSADGKVLWLSGRYDGEVYAISTRTGRLLARVAVGAGPHGLCVWPQPGRFSLGHTGVLR
ncbi:MAG TPA: hypothetical protein VFJ60_11145 [Gaiella sp.]|nr:hypothetical protein [Gaiella sp.]